MACAAYVHVSIALSRTASWAVRCDGTYRFPMGLLVFARDEVSIVGNSQDLVVLLKLAVRHRRCSGPLRGTKRAFTFDQSTVRASLFQPLEPIETAQSGLERAAAMVAVFTATMRFVKSQTG